MLCPCAFVLPPNLLEKALKPPLLTATSPFGAIELSSVVNDDWRSENWDLFIGVQSFVLRITSVHELLGHACRNQKSKERFACAEQFCISMVNAPHFLKDNVLLDAARLPYEHHVPSNRDSEFKISTIETEKLDLPAITTSFF
ncbi:hypothetical protein M5K25_004734 [Dendrobium thyrsiflorum]|uniref:Uncharacterized protein n=1 Tax=Dendrobium thyrsiflorum TaxID=117978 RepID=A0ABD0VN06_DENTH